MVDALERLMHSITKLRTNTRNNLEFSATRDLGCNHQIKLRPAEVLLGVAIDHKIASMLLTRRSSNLKYHPAEIAFPGGKCEAYDKKIGDAALRETHEEIGLSPQKVTIMTRLPTHDTITNFRITPILARIENFTPQLSQEVTEIFYIPLSYLFDLTKYRIEQRIFKGQLRRYYVIAYGSYYIWGATARILHKLALLEKNADYS